MHESGHQTMDREELAEKLGRYCPYNEHRRDGFALVNVLDPARFAEARIPGSANIPLGEVDRFERIFDKDKEIIVYCASPECDASERAARELTRRGFRRVTAYTGGLSAWKAAGDPLVGTGA